AIYIPFPQAVPSKPVIDAANCTKFKTGKCGICSKKCAAGAVNYEDKDEVITEEVRAIVVATGYQLQKKINVTDEELKSCHIKQHHFHGEWNHTMKPKILT
ncbi:MAG: hypothetical protein LBJ67_06730, partial [Planctomycetaceae bacterium]|nr:hypothetical protein [Planctomycetaceae bacterium]